MNSTDRPQSLGADDYKPPEFSFPKKTVSPGDADVYVCTTGVWVLEEFP